MHINSSEHILLLLCVCACSVVSNSLWPYELQPSRLLCPWDFPGKSPEVGCHSPLQDIFPTLGSNPMALASSMLAGEFFTTESPGKPILWCWCKKRILVFFFWGFCFICPFESCFFLFTRHTEVIHCLYIFVNVNWVIPNAFPIIKIATLKIIVLCYLC